MITVLTHACIARARRVQCVCSIHHLPAPTLPRVVFWPPSSSSRRGGGSVLCDALQPHHHSNSLIRESKRVCISARGQYLPTPTLPRTPHPYAHSAHTHHPSRPHPPRPTPPTSSPGGVAPHTSGICTIKHPESQNPFVRIDNFECHALFRQ